MAKRPVRLAQTLGRILKSSGWEGRLSEYRIHGQWERTVGPGIAAHAQPLSLRGRKLTLSVDSPAWMQQLSLMKPEIIEKLNRNLGAGLVSDITLRIGELAPRGRPVEKQPDRPELDQEERAKIDQYVAGIHDEEIREALRRVIEKDFRTKKRTDAGKKK